MEIENGKIYYVRFIFRYFISNLIKIILGLTKQFQLRIWLKNFKISEAENSMKEISYMHKYNTSLNI